MKLPYTTIESIDAKYICIDIIDDYCGDILECLPLINNWNWKAYIDIDTGYILNWTTDKNFSEFKNIVGSDKIYKLFLKVVDRGIYKILDSNFKVLFEINDYVPNFIPNEFGDYVDLKIEVDTGKIINFNKNMLLEYNFEIK